MMSFVNVQDKVQNQLRLMISENSLPNESKPFTLAKIFNKACMDQEQLEIRGISPIVDILETYGGWPVASISRFYLQVVDLLQWNLIYL